MFTHRGGGEYQRIAVLYRDRAASLFGQLAGLDNNFALAEFGGKALRFSHIAHGLCILLRIQKPDSQGLGHAANPRVSPMLQFLPCQVHSKTDARVGHPGYNQ